jgi:hypothetical protein
LDLEGQHISNHEELGELVSTDDAVLFALGQKNNASQDHVDARGEEGGRDQRQDRLHDVRTKLPVRCFSRTDDSLIQQRVSVKKE